MDPIEIGVGHKSSRWYIWSCSTSDIHHAADANNRSYVTHGDHSWAKTNEVTCNLHKPNISVFIRDTVSNRITKFMKTILMKPNIVSTERRILHLQVLLEFCEHINGKFTRWTFKLPLIKKVLFKLWSRSSCISGTC
jgi:hypothetical protein